MALETAANLRASQHKANDFFTVFSSFELEGITKHLNDSGPIGDSEWCFLLTSMLHSAVPQRTLRAILGHERTLTVVVVVLGGSAGAGIGTGAAAGSGGLVVVVVLPVLVLRCLCCWWWWWTGGVSAGGSCPGGADASSGA